MTNYDLDPFIKNIKFTSRFTHADKDLLNSFTQEKKVITYSDSWLYLLKGSRDEYGRLSYKYYDKEIFFTFSFINNSFYIGKVYGINDKNFLRFINFIEILKEIHVNPIVLKKTTIEFRKLLNKYYDYKEKVKGIKLFDESSPEKVLYLPNIFRGDKIKPKRFRLGINRFLNKDVKISSYDFNNNLSYKKSIKCLEYLSKGSLEKYYSNKAMIDYIYSNGNESIIFTYFKGQSKIEGLYICEIISKNSVGLYCGLTSTKYGGITEYLDYLLFKKLLNKGYDYVYLGGSETLGVEKYVQKLRPIDTIYNEKAIII